MKKVAINLGYEVLVDDEDFDRVSAMKWYALKRPHQRTEYAYRQEHIPSSGYGKKDWGYRHVLMHRFILGIEDGRNVDHRDGNGLNNQRSNLRIASRLGLNVANGGVRPDSKSGLKGVSARKSRRFEASIRSNGKSTSLGSYADPKDAARAYDAAAIEAFGEFAKTNEMLGLLR